MIFGKLNKALSRVSGALYTGYNTGGLKAAWGGVKIAKSITLMGRQYISIGKDTAIGKNATITAWKKGDDPSIIIGDKCILGDYIHLTSSNYIEIGTGVLTGKWVTITDNSHGRITKEELELRPSQREVFSKGPVIIKDRVWIGDKVTILPGVTVGEAAIIGANSVVTKDVPPFAVVAGNPAKIIRIIS